MPHIKETFMYSEVEFDEEGNRIKHARTLEDMHKIEDPVYKAKVERAYEGFLKTLRLSERDWRNQELKNTDWMMIPDATFKGVELAGSLYLQQVIEYRKALRAYDLCLEDRPIKPTFL